MAEFTARVHAGVRISKEEMERKYLPLVADYKTVADWFRSQGIKVLRTEANHTKIFLSAPVAKVSSVLETTFARVATVHGEYTSAISAPKLPTKIAPLVLAIHGLQPHIRQRPMSAPFPSGNAPLAYMGPQLSTEYNIPSNLSGSGQTVAIVGQGTGANLQI